MIYIKDLFAKINQNASKAKFYSHNQSIFLKYFDSEQQYKALISAGNFRKIDEIIAGKTNFNQNEFFKTIHD